MQLYVHTNSGLQYSIWSLNNNPEPSEDFFLTNGQLTVNYIGQSTGVSASGFSSKGASSTLIRPKVYWEIVLNSILGGSEIFTGISNSSLTLTNSFLGMDANGWGYDSFNGFIYHNNTEGIHLTGYTVNDIIGFALDMTNGFLYVSKNGTWLNGGVPTSGALGTGAIVTGLTGTIYPAWGVYAGITAVITANFGQSSFTESVPSGYSTGIY